MVKILKEWGVKKMTRVLLDDDIDDYRNRPEETVYEWQWIHQYIDESWDITPKYHTEPPLGRGYLNLNKYEPSKRVKK